MLKDENFSENHIRQLQTKTHKDPILLEKAIYAFGLLAALEKVGLPFIFKGGTCLCLLLKHPLRLSTDIDIIVEPNAALDGYLEKAASVFPFIGFEEHARVTTSKIRKKHYKFQYRSPISKKTSAILLDVLFEHNNYSELVQKEIKTDFLLTESTNEFVTIPSPNCLLADKLTAFAPHTTEIPLSVGKDMEVMKQFYDIASLLEVITDFNQIGPTYRKISKAEIYYREIDKSPEDCLWDTFYSGFCIASRGKVNPKEYPIYVKGIRELRNHIYATNFTPETATGQAVEIMYLTLCLLTDVRFQLVESENESLSEPLGSKILLSLRYLRKINAKAYSYAVKIDKLLSIMNKSSTE